MAEKNNAICTICGKEYRRCISCKSQMKAEPWKIYADTPEHYKIFQVIQGFDSGVYTKEEARDKLKNINLSDLDELRDHIKKIIKNIMKEDKRQKEVDSVIDESLNKSTSIVSSYAGRKRKYSESAEVIVEAEQ